MDDLETLKADLTEMRRQLALVNSQLETVGVSEAERIALRNDRVALLTKEKDLKEEIKSLNPLASKYFPSFSTTHFRILYNYLL